MTELDVIKRAHLESCPECRAYRLRWRLVEAIAMLVLVLSMCQAGCSTPKPPTTLLELLKHPGYPVHIVSWPSEPETSCYLAEQPPLPTEEPYPEEADVFKRTMTPRRMHDDLLQAVHDMAEVISTMRLCLEKLQERTKKR